MSKQVIDQGKNWYVIHTYSGYEDAVAKNLKQRIESLGMENKIFNVIQQIATDEDLDFVFDRSGDVMMLYAKEKYDLTVKVLEQLKLE